MLEEYRRHEAERLAQGIPAKPLNTEQTKQLVKLFLSPSKGEEETLLTLLSQRVPPGVDDAARVKADFLAAIATKRLASPLISPLLAVEWLGTMLGGYNIPPLINALDDDSLAATAANALSHTLLLFDKFYQVENKAKSGNRYAQQVIQSWADAEWFTSRPKLADKITLTVFKITGETNTDDLSPAPDAWSRPDIPLHALVMLKNPREGIIPDIPGEVGPLKQLNQLKEKGYSLTFVGDVLGTGSSRKSATNSVIWYIGQDIPYVPNKRTAGIVMAGKIAPIYFNTMEDSGALPIELDVSNINMGDVIDVYPYLGEVRHHQTGKLLSTFKLKTEVLLDEVQAGGRIPLIIGRDLTAKARASLNLGESSIFRLPKAPEESSKGYSLAQKIVGKACGVKGVRPGQYCEPKMTTVGSQDTTGTMTRDELKDLACLEFSADLFMQSFCHTASYPKPVDIKMHRELPDFMISRGGIVLKPGDGIIHSWINRMLIPDTMGTGGDSHTRFPIGLSFPAGSGLVAFAAATGIMPLDMPESVLVRFSGKMQPGITLRDLVHAIPYYAIKQGLLTIDKKGKKNIFSGRILEIQGLSSLKVEQAFELSNASAERSAAACTIQLDKEPIIEYLHSNIVLLKGLIADGYQNAETINRRIIAMEAWLKDPQLLQADENAEYAAVIEIDLEQLKEPILCAPNDPDDARLLSEVAGEPIDEVFIGSCMTNIGHFRAAGKLLNRHKGKIASKLWLAPPTRMDNVQLKQEGYFSIYCQEDIRIELPGCSLCMGNQARMADNSTVVSTSTRNFPNRLGNNTHVYLASAELASVAALYGRLPTVKEYLDEMSHISDSNDETYRYLNFDQIESYQDKAKSITVKNY